MLFFGGGGKVVVEKINILNRKVNQGNIATFVKLSEFEAVSFNQL